MKNLSILTSFLILIFTVVPSASAQLLEDLSARIFSIETRIDRIEKEYEKQKKANEDRLRKSEEARAKNNTAEAESQIKEAYTSADQMNTIYAQLNYLKYERQQLCEQWRGAYRKSIDRMLKDADGETDKKKKGQIGRRLQQYQSLNSRLCSGSSIPKITQDWKALRIENFDGPQQIHQKIQLLKDIHREVSIALAKVDQDYEDAKIERKAKERAEEFIEEATLFTDNVTVRTPPSTPPATQTPTAPAPVEVMDRSLNEPEGSTVLGSADPQTEGSFERIGADYEKNRAELLAQQKDLQKRIQEFEEKAKILMFP